MLSDKPILWEYITIYPMTISEFCILIEIGTWSIDENGVSPIGGISIRSA
jgi:hypothetical protein